MQKSVDVVVDQKFVNVVVDQIISVVEKGLTGLTKNGQEIDIERGTAALATFSSYHQIVKTISRNKKVGRTFSQSYMEKVVASLLLDVAKNAEKDNLSEIATSQVATLVKNLMSFDKKYQIYLPIDGLVLSPELGKVQFGDATLIQIDPDRFSELQLLLTGEDRIYIEDKKKQLNELKEIRDRLEKQVIKALKSGDEKCESHYKKKKLDIENEIKPIELSLKTSQDKVSRRQMPIEGLKDTLCAIYHFSAESSKAIEYAEQEHQKVLSLLRYAISSAQMREIEGKDRLREAVLSYQIALAVASDATDFQIVGSKTGTRHPFEITNNHVSLMRAGGIFEMAETFSGSHGPMNEIESMVERCINWFSLSQEQPDKVTEFLSLVIILEILLTSGDKSASISTTIAEAAAILLADSEEERQKIRSEMRKIYDLRSKVVHGTSAPDQVDFHAHLVEVRNTVIRTITVIWKLMAAGKFQRNEKADLTRLISSIKFQGPSIQA